MISHRLIILLLHRIVIQNVSWKAKQRSRRITVLPDLPFSTFKAFCFSDVEGFDVHCLLKLMVCQKYFLVSIIIVITIVIISIHFFVYIFIPLIFLIECQETCFKNSSYVFSKSGTRWNFNWYVCWYQGGFLSLYRNWRRMAVYQSWDSKVYCLKY